MIKIGCKILLKKEVLDSRGRAILKILEKENLQVQDCRYGKYIELTIDTKNSQEALKRAEKLAQNILHNPLVESFELEVLDNK